MNFWIESARKSLERTIRRRHRAYRPGGALLTQQPTLLRAARQIMGMGPSVVVVKQGEYGAARLTKDGFFSIPAFPLETVIDPTGAGDSFAGGLLAPRRPRRRHRCRHPSPCDGLPRLWPRAGWRSWLRASRGLTGEEIDERFGGLPAHEPDRGRHHRIGATPSLTSVSALGSARRPLGRLADGTPGRSTRRRLGLGRRRRAAAGGRLPGSARG